MSPGRSRFDLRAQAQEQGLTCVGPRELHADGQAVLRPVQGQRHGRLAGDVELRGERGDLDRAFPALLQIDQITKPRWRRSQDGRHEDVEAVRPPGGYAAREGVEMVQFLDVVQAVLRLASLESALSRRTRDRGVTEAFRRRLGGCVLPSGIINRCVQLPSFPGGHQHRTAIRRRVFPAQGKATSRLESAPSLIALHFFILGQNTAAAMFVTCLVSSAQRFLEDGLFRAPC